MDKLKIIIRLCVIVMGFGLYQFIHAMKPGRFSQQPRPRGFQSQASLRQPVQVRLKPVQPLVLQAITTSILPILSEYQKIDTLKLSEEGFDDVVWSERVAPNLDSLDEVFNSRAIEEPSLKQFVHKILQSFEGDSFMYKDSVQMTALLESTLFTEGQIIVSNPFYYDNAYCNELKSFVNVVSSSMPLIRPDLLSPEQTYVSPLYRVKRALVESGKSVVSPIAQAAGWSWQGIKDFAGAAKSVAYGAKGLVVSRPQEEIKRDLAQVLWYKSQLAAKGGLDDAQKAQLENLKFKEAALRSELSGWFGYVQ